MKNKSETDIMLACYGYDSIDYNINKDIIRKHYTIEKLNDKKIKKLAKKYKKSESYIINLILKQVKHE